MLYNWCEFCMLIFVICELCIKSYSFSAGCHCSECGEGWLKYRKSCFFFSKERRNWQQGRKMCRKKGGDLVVIDNDAVQVNQSINQLGELKLI